MGKYDRMTYAEAAHAVQTAVQLKMNCLDDWKGASPKHLRVGVDLRASDAKGLVDLLIAKGLFTAEEYLEATRKAAIQEVEQRELELRDIMHLRPDQDITLA